MRFKLPVPLKVSEGVGSEGVKEGDGVTRDRERVDSVVESVKFCVGVTESEWECVSPEGVMDCVTLRLKLAVVDRLPDKEGGGADPVVLTDGECVRVTEEDGEPVGVAVPRELDWL